MDRDGRGVRAKRRSRRHSWAWWEQDVDALRGGGSSGIYANGRRPQGAVHPGPTTLLPPGTDESVGHRREREGSAVI